MLIKMGLGIRANYDGINKNEETPVAAKEARN